MFPLPPIRTPLTRGRTEKKFLTKMALVKDNDDDDGDDDDDDDDPAGYCKNLGVCCGPRQGGVGRPPGDSWRSLGSPSGAPAGSRRVSISDP